MLLRLFLNTIKPSNKELKSKTRGIFTKIKILLYQSMLKRLLKTYSHYAISDTIFINSRKIKIVHEYRDVEFENELVRNKIPFKPKVTDASIPMTRQKSRRTRHLSYFNFKSLLTAYVDARKVFVKHDESYSVYGDINGRIKVSSANDAITQSVIEILSPYRTSVSKETSTPLSIEKAGDSIEVKKPEVKPLEIKKPQKTTKKPAKGLFEKDRVILTITPKADSDNNDTNPEKRLPQPEEQPLSIEKKGFEIDTSF